MPLADVAVVQDQGILVSNDIVAVDMATLDLIGKAEPLPGSKGMEAAGKAGHILQRITGKDPYRHVLAAAELGLGDTSYELVEVERKSGAKAGPAFGPSTDRIPLHVKGHGWRRGGSHNPHPCQEK